MSHAPPVYCDFFSYAGGSLFVDSGHHRHPRAPISDLQALFHPKNPEQVLKEPAGHWYEAQLLHYGLPTSKTKAVAKTRLLDALNKGQLAIPAQIQMVEAGLKKEWNKREARVGLKGTKRKSDGSENKVNKKSRTSDSSPKSYPPLAQDERRPKQTARRGGFSPAVNREPQPYASTSVQKQTARYSGPPRGGGSVGRAPATKREDVSWDALAFSPEPQQKTRQKQTARYSGPPRGGSTAKSNRRIKDKPIVDQEPTSPTPSTKLGLLNGTYAIECASLEQWSQYEGYYFTLVLTLQKNSIWGAFDFGMFSGILYLEQRPVGQPSKKPLAFRWRGRESSEGMIHYADNTEQGWIKFLGGGEIQGHISCYGGAEFQGTRISGQQTTSQRDAASMRREWDGYSQEQYEYEEKARWK